MGKKRLALFLAVLMLFSLLPTTAFSEGSEPAPAEEQQIEQQQEEQNPTIRALNNAMAGGATPEDAHQAMDEAGEKERAAAGSYSTGSQHWWQEIGAAASNAQANGHLNSAEQATNTSDAVTKQAGDYAEGQAQSADAAADAAAAAAAAAAAEGQNANAALQDAEGATNKQDAAAAANAAQAASVAAQQAAEEAIAAAEQAAENAANAQNAYETALAVYEQAKEEAETQLEQGLIDAQTAEQLTADAARSADEAYNDMLAAQQAAETALEEAQAASDAADAVLQEKVDALNAAITANAQNVAEKTGVAAATGAALAAAKIAAGVVDQEVGYYELRVEATQEEIDEVQARIDEAQDAIDEAKAEVDARKADLDQADEAYSERLKELEEAEAELKAAQDVVDNLQAVLDARAEAEQAGVTNAFDKVVSGEASAADRQKVTEYVLGSASQYDENATDLSVKEWVTDDVFTIEDEQGKLTYYQVKTVEETDDEGQVTNRYLQFVQVEPKDEEIVDSLPDGKTSFNNAAGTGSTRTTDLIARDAAGNVYPVKIKKTTFIVTWYDFQVEGMNLNHDSNGYYFGSGSSKTYVTLVEPLSETVYEETEGGLGGSSAVSDKWDAAEHADENLNRKEAAMQNAADAVETAYDAQQQALGAYSAAADVLSDLEEDKAADQEKVEQLKEELQELDKKLNGSFTEQLTVAFLDNGLDGVNDKIGQNIGVLLDEQTQQKYDGIQANIASLQEQLETATGIKRALLIAAITEQNLEAAAITGRALANADVDLEEVQQQGAAIAEVLGALSDGETNLDDATAVANLLLNGGLSAKTKQFIAGKIVEVLDGLHDKAVEDLKEAVEQGVQEIAAATAETAEAGAAALEAQALETITEGAKALADALLEDAETKKQAADEAAAAAAEAVRVYEEIADSYGPSDEDVERAKEAAQQAAAAAERAAQEAWAAQVEAEQAEADYLEAKRIADAFQDELDSAQLGMTIAEFAASLVGTVYAERVNNDPEKLNSREFVKYVYGAFDIAVNLDGYNVSYLIDGTSRRPGDLLVLTGSEGSVNGYGVSYDTGSYVTFNEETGLVEMTETSAENVSIKVMPLF